MSFLPGLTESTEVPDVFFDANELHKLNIPQGSLWKIKIPSESKMSIKVVGGIAEIFGTELANNVEYVFQSWCFTIYAVEEVELEWKGVDNHPALEGEDIIPNDTAKYVYNLHFSLEKMRNSTFDGPNIMIVGNKASGKTSLCRTLSSYTIKFKTYQPMLINLNPQEGIFSPPGCLSATPISDILDIQLPIWGQSMTSGATALHSKQPLVKVFGQETISENRDYYLSILDQLADDVRERLQRDALVQRSGCIIDTPPLSQLSDELTELTDAIKKFKVNIVIFISDDSNEEQFETVAQKLKPFVGDFFLKIPKLSGAIEVDDVYQRALQRSAIREYFYGNSHTALSPFSVSIDYEDLVVWEPKNLLELQSATIDSTRTNNLELKPIEITPSNLQHSLIAITYAEKHAKPNDVQEASILGFALITEVNEKRRKVRVLLPVPGNFPSNAVILTSYRYLE